MLKVLDLFSGIGGFSLGLERTGGFTTSAFCEICPKARKVLSKHWPNVKQYTDIRELTDEQLKKDGIEVDVITGGFPCQDISSAGKGRGIIGERSGLWSEMLRIIGDVRPAWAIIENVSALRSKGLTLVLQNLCEIGYLCQWHCIPASAVGAHHQRDRIWIIAHCDTNSYGKPTMSEHDEARRLQEYDRDTDGGNGRTVGEVQGRQDSKPCGICEEVANPYDSGPHGEKGHETKQSSDKQIIGVLIGSNHWQVEPNVGRVAHGVPHRVDRLKQLGNSVVPQIPELIGNAILEII